MITRTPGYIWKGADVVTPARLNRAITEQIVKAGYNTLLGVGEPPPVDPDADPSQSPEDTAPVVEIPCSAAGRAILAADENDPATLAALAPFLKIIYPVGSAYTSFTEAVLPAHVAAVGSWEKLHGVTIIAADTRETGADADFAPGKTVHDKTFKLDAKQLPASKVKIPGKSFEGTLETNEDGEHAHEVNTADSDLVGGRVDRGEPSQPVVTWKGTQTANDSTDIPVSIKLGKGGKHKHATDLTKLKTPELETENLGEGAAIQHLPPYATTHIWVRTA